MPLYMQLFTQYGLKLFDKRFVNIVIEMRKSVKNIATMVENVVAQTNQGYENSKIPVRVKLHCMEAYL